MVSDNIHTHYTHTHRPGYSGNSEGYERAPKTIKTSEGTLSYASSASSNVIQDFENWSFYPLHLKRFEKMDRTEKYTLKSLTESLRVNINTSDNAVENNKSDIAVEKVVQCILQNYGTLSTKVLPAFIFNGKGADELKTFYDSKHNRSDVGVWIDNSNVLNMEVNSSPTSEAVSKVIHGLIEFLRVAKAHHIDKELQGFALLKLGEAGLIVKVTVYYDASCIAFRVKCEVLKKCCLFLMN